VLTPLRLAAALLVWPDGAARGRLRRVVGAPTGSWRAATARWGERVPAALWAPVVAAAVALTAAGPLQACAAVLLAATAVDLRRRARDHRSALATHAAWERALDDASSALRAGAGPEVALDRAAAAAADVASVRDLLGTARSHARLGGDVGAGLSHSGDPVAAELAGAWLLASRHGVPLASVVDGLRADVGARREQAVRADATLAGPRATAVILTALPGFGVVMGSGFGADPLGVLTSGLLGGILCLVGAGLLAAGLLWTGRIVDGARP
jgi:tight adherence protein B